MVIRLPSFMTTETRSFPELVFSSFSPPAEAILKNFLAVATGSEDEKILRHPLCRLGGIRAAGGKAVLKARNPEIGDIELENDAEYLTKYRAIAEFKGVIS